MFHGAERVVVVDGLPVSAFVVVRDENDLKSIVVDSIRIDLETGRTFQGGTPQKPVALFGKQSHSVTHPLFQQNVIRYEYDGKISGNSGEKFLTGTRRVMVGEKAIVEQRYVNGPIGDWLEDDVWIDPGTDRIFCFCSGAAELAIFDGRKLGAGKTPEPLAYYAGDFTDAIRDDDGNGLIDGITVTPHIRVTRAGEYIVRVRLRSDANVETHAFVTVSLTAGDARIPIAFGRHHIDGLGAPPYAIHAIEVQKGTTLVDEKLDVGRTQPTKAKLESDFVSMTGKTAVVRLDQDHDGRAERVRIDVEVRLALTGVHAFLGRLSTENNEALGDVVVQADYTAGEHTVSFVFDGGKIADLRRDTRLRLRVQVLGKGGGEFQVVTDVLRSQDFE